ncbi:MAG: 3D domain-containing protein, partial [Lachnospiraceae bacterium]|nr:3D domain-containing protein [Lachnospiraceae bacterium]
TKVVINGQVYVAEDRGGAIKGKRIDMFFMTHKEALRWGRRTMTVYLAD